MKTENSLGSFASCTDLPLFLVPCQSGSFIVLMVDRVALEMLLCLHWCLMFYEVILEVLNLDMSIVSNVTNQII
jgi:hypothetical protein